MTEYCDGDYYWSTMWGTYPVPMLVLDISAAGVNILFWDDYAKFYEERVVQRSELVLAHMPAGWVAL